MGLIGQVSVVTPEAQAAATIRQVATELYNAILPKYKMCYNLVWNNPRATPGKVLAQLGTDAGELFAVSAATAQLLVAAGATGIPTTLPASWSFAVNADGSVTLAPVNAAPPTS